MASSTAVTSTVDGAAVVSSSDVGSAVASSADVASAVASSADVASAVVSSYDAATVAAAVAPAPVASPAAVAPAPVASPAVVAPPAPDTAYKFTLLADVVSSLEVGRATCHVHGKRALLLFKLPDGSIKVAPNNCAHRAARLLPDIEDAGLFTCSEHGAQLDAATMTYTSGPKFEKQYGNFVVRGTPQPVYDVVVNSDGTATVVVPEHLRDSCCVVS